MMGMGANVSMQNMTPIYGANGMPTGMYTLNSSMGINAPPPTPPQPSMVEEMIKRAQMASQNVNVPNIADLFPYMNTNYQPYAQQQAPMMQTPSAPMQSSGAGRFLNAGDNTNAPALNYGVNTVT